MPIIIQTIAGVLATIITGYYFMWVHDRPIEPNKDKSEYSTPAKQVEYSAGEPTKWDAEQKVDSVVNTKSAPKHHKSRKLYPKDKPAAEDGYRPLMDDFNN
jgi:hypothetical protein